MNADNDLDRLTRRQFLHECGLSLGKIALAGLLVAAASRAAPGDSRRESPRPARLAGPTDPLAPRKPHFAAKAKRVIHLFMAGAPSQLDLFDHKPELAKLEGKPLAALGDRRPALRLHPSRRRRAGAALQVRQARPDAARRSPRCCRTWPTVVDDICLVKSMHTDQFNHAPAQIFFNTGFAQPGRPSLGSWVIYGLGCETQRSAGLRGDVHRQRHQRRLGQLVERLPADRLHRRPPAQPGRSDPERLQPAGRRCASCSATRSTWSGR